MASYGQATTTTGVLEHAIVRTKEGSASITAGLMRS